MRSYRNWAVAVLTVICMLSGIALASDHILRTEKTADTISIQPTDSVLFEIPKDTELCDHDYYVHTVGETVRHPIDDYHCCYIDVTVNMKICRLCLAPGYDLDYVMVPHQEATGICEYCGRVPFTPAIAIPLT